MKKLIGLLAFSTIIGCSSGGDNNFGYSGNTEALKITEENGEEIVSETLDDASASSDIGDLGFSGINNKARNKVKQQFQKMRARIIESRASFSDTIPSSCGDGEMNISATGNELSGDSKFVISFNDYCDEADSTVVNGKIVTKYSVQDSDDSFVINLSMSFENFSAVSDEESFSMNGSAKGSMDILTLISIKYNMAFVDNLTGEEVLLQNFLIEAAGFFDAEVSMSGRVYNSTSGYVDIETVTPLVVDLNSGNYESGELKFTGADGSEMVLTALDSTQYKLEIDSDGDGVYESSETQDWELLDLETL